MDNMWKTHVEFMENIWNFTFDFSKQKNTNQFIFHEFSRSSKLFMLNIIKKKWILLETLLKYNGINSGE